MAVKKFYAVKKGKITGVFDKWEECKLSVDGYPGAVYKGFSTLEEAQAYLGIETGGWIKITDVIREKANPLEERKEDRNTDKNIEGNADRKIAAGSKGGDKLLVYVDGSFEPNIQKYSFGCVFILPDGRIFTEFGNGDNEQSLQHRNVTGEMLGAMYAVKTAMMNGFKAVEICYDYQGIEKWVTGEWRSKTELTQLYTKSMREWGRNIALYFTKVAAHTNVYYNEMADKLAKQGLVEGNGVPKVRKLEELTPWNKCD